MSTNKTKLVKKKINKIDRQIPNETLSFNEFLQLLETELKIPRKFLFIGTLFFVLVFGILISYALISRTLNPLPETFIFSGKIVDTATGEWNNNRLILVYEREKEVGRAISSRGEFPENKLGILDGLFVVEIPNSYKFKLSDFKDNKVPFDFFSSSRVVDPEGWESQHSYTVLYHWFPEFKEGGSISFDMKSKNLTYTILSLSGDVNTLPPEIMGGKTEYRAGKLIAIPAESVPAEISEEVSGEYSLQDVVYKTSVDEVVINKITEPLDNCKSDTELETTYTYAQTFVHKYLSEKSVGGNIEISIPAVDWAKIVLELQSKYGFEDNQIDSSTFTQPMKAAPHTYQFYTITWTEIWENGVVNVVKNGQLEQIPFKVKTNLVHSVISETRACQ